MIVPSIGTSIVAFKLICARLQLHVSGASKPRLASSASAGNSGCSLRGNASSLMTSLRPCIILLLPHTAKGASTSSEELNAQISPRTDDEYNLPTHEDQLQEH